MESEMMKRLDFYSTLSRILHGLVIGHVHLIARCRGGIEYRLC